METKSEIKSNEPETYKPLAFSLLIADKDKMEKARKIVIKKLQTFIQQLKSEDRSFEIEREDSAPYSFEVREIEDYLNQIEHELLIVDSTYEYRLEWDIKIPMLNTIYDPRKLDLMEAIINNCFGSIVCQGSFKPTTHPANFVSGKICFHDIARILLEADYEEDVVVESQLPTDEFNLEDIHGRLNLIDAQLTSLQSTLVDLNAHRNKDIFEEYKVNRQNLYPQKESLYTEVKPPKDNYRNWVNLRAAHFFRNTAPEIAVFPIMSLWNSESYCSLIILGLTGILAAATVISLGLALAASIVAALIYIVSWPIAAGIDLLEDCLDSADYESSTLNI
jgi:hypothetical protein